MNNHKSRQQRYIENNQKPNYKLQGVEKAKSFYTRYPKLHETRPSEPQIPKKFDECDIENCAWPVLSNKAVIENNRRIWGTEDTAKSLAKLSLDK